MPDIANPAVRNLPEEVTTYVGNHPGCSLEEVAANLGVPFLDAVHAFAQNIRREGTHRATPVCGGTA